MAPSKRSRACDNCHSIKIKCELGSSGGDPPCERCVRLGKDCVISPSKRQKDRVAELEAQVESLTRLLQSQNIQVDLPRSDGSEASLTTNLKQNTKEISGSSEETYSSKKKRRIEDVSSGESEDDQDGENSGNKLYEMDRLVGIPTQRFIVDKYLNEMMPKFALVSLPDKSDYDSLRNGRPLLLHAILYAACQGMLPADVQDAVGEILMGQFGASVFSNAAKSIDHVQAIQVASIWFRNPKFHTTICSPDMIQLAIDTAKDVGLGPVISTSPFTSQPMKFQGNCVDAWRIWLVCYLLCGINSSILRISRPIYWSTCEDLTLVKLEYWPYGSENEQKNDRLLAQYVRAEKLCEQISTQHYFLHPDTVSDVASPETQAGMATSRNLVTDWKAQIPQQMDTPLLKFWEHIALLYIHECVLHTRTNKRSFGAPYVAERLSVTDFPAPAVVTEEHVKAILALRDNAHALLDLFLNLDLSTIMSLPPLLFSSRVLYGEWILIKLYISLTGPGNSFGGYVDYKSLEIDQYLESLIQLKCRVHEIDPRCGTARILAATVRRREWLWNYRATYMASGCILEQQLSASSSPPPPSSLQTQLQQPQLESSSLNNMMHNSPSAAITSSSLDFWGYDVDTYGLSALIDPQLILSIPDT